MTPRFKAAVMTPAPMGFVSSKKSPSLAVEFRLTFSVGMMPVTANPNIGSRLSTLCPPARGIPAS